MYKKVLIIALNKNWTGISRLPEGLKRAGFDPYTLCPRSSYLALTHHLNGGIFYPTFTYSRSKFIYVWILLALLTFKPDLIIPGDEDAIKALHNFANFFENIPYFSRFSHLIRASLTPKEFDSFILSKSDFQQKCTELGLRTPKNIVVKNLEVALSEAQIIGYPVVIKHDSGYGGSGVFICQNSDDLKSHFKKIKNAPLLIKAKSWIKDFLFVSILSSEPKISIQQFIKGTIGQAPFCAKDGVVFAFNPMIRLQTYPGDTGPATVSAGHENIDTEHFVRTVAKALHFTGFGSLEYMIEESSGQLYIIELNPRPTPTCHISDEVVPNDLGKIFFKGINAHQLEISTFKPFTIVMFPGEKRRDPQSPYIKNAYHDIPLNDPELLKALDM